MKIAGFWAALVPVIVTLISYEGLQTLLTQVTDSATSWATGTGLDSIAVSVIAGILGAIGSGILAYYKEAKSEPAILARGGAIEYRPSPFWFGA